MATGELQPRRRIFPFTTWGSRGATATPAREATVLSHIRVDETLEENITRRPRRIPEKPKSNNKIGLMVRGAIATLAIAATQVGHDDIRANDNTPSPASRTQRVDPSEPNSFNSEAPQLIKAFDNTARSGEIRTVKRISEEETARLDSFAKIGDHNTVLVIFPIDVSTSKNPNSKLEFAKQYSGSGNDQDRADRAGQGYLNIYYIEKVRAGSTILAPVDGNLIVFMNHNHREDTTNDHPFFQAMIAFQPREGEEFRVGITGRSVEGGMMNKRLDVFRSLTDAPVYDPERPEVLKQVFPVKKGYPILQAEMDIDVSFSMGGDFDSSTTREETLNGGTKVEMKREQPTNLELFLEDGAVVQPFLQNNKE